MVEIHLYAYITNYSNGFTTSYMLINDTHLLNRDVARPVETLLCKYMHYNKI